MQWILVVLAAAMLLYFLLPRFAMVSLEEASRKIRNGAHLVDVRTEPEFLQKSVPGSVNLPLHDLKDAIRESGIQPSDPVLVFCYSGIRSISAKRILTSMGYLDVANLGSLDRAGKAIKLSEMPETGSASNKEPRS
ncbi:MAG: rhodanese-like domain-containing protein [Oceanipulchritudo sp.]